jgi:hypothetical protein
MITNLVSFGCGWTYGSDLTLPYEQAYPALIAKQKNWTLENLAVPNTTLYEMILALRNWLANNTEAHIAETLILVGLTVETPGSALADEKTTYEEVVTAFDQAAAEYDAHLLQFNVLTKNYKIKVPTLIESSSALEMLVIRDKPRKEPLFTEHKFPNEQGHAILADFIISKFVDRLS